MRRSVSARDDALMMIGWEGTKTLDPRDHTIRDLMALCYLLGALGVLNARHP